MIVTCVYKSGGDFTAEHVLALKNGLDKNMPCDFEFWCFTDKPEEVAGFVDKTIQLLHDLPGWWSKIELFRAVYKHQHILYFDLDVLILKLIDQFFINTIEEYSPIMLRSSDPKGYRNDWPSSSIMAWQGNNLNNIYLKFFQLGNVIERAKIDNPSYAGQQGDQGFIRTCVNPNKFQDYLPENYILFKNEYLHNPKRFKEAVILNWTGKPRFKNMGPGLKRIKNLWNNQKQYVS